MSFVLPALCSFCPRVNLNIVPDNDGNNVSQKDPTMCSAHTNNRPVREREMKGTKYPTIIEHTSVLVLDCIIAC